MRKIQDVSTKWIREVLDKLKISASHINSEDNGSDVMTKALDVVDTRHHCRFGLGVVAERHCSSSFVPRTCNGRSCRLFTSELGGEFGGLNDPCYCNGGRPRKREFKKDYVYFSHSLTHDDAPPTSVLHADIPESIIEFAALTGCVEDLRTM